MMMNLFSKKKLDKSNEIWTITSVKKKNYLLFQNAINAYEPLSIINAIAMDV